MKLESKTLLVVVLVVLAALAGVGVATAADDSTSNGWQSCANAPNAAEGDLNASDTALYNAAEGVVTARTAACGEDA